MTLTPFTPETSSAELCVHNSTASPTIEANTWLANFTSARTRDGYRDAVGAFIAASGCASLAEFARLERRHVIAWRDQLMAAGAKPRTVAQRLSAVSSLFKHLQETGIARDNPVKGVRRPRVAQDRVQSSALSAREVRRLLDAPQGDQVEALRDRAILHVYAYTGCRLAEPAALTVRDFGWEQSYRILDFTVKGGKRNRVAIHPEAASAVQAYLDAAGHGGETAGALFRAGRGPRAGQGLTVEGLRHLLAKYTQSAGLPPGTTPHSLRATFVTEALQQNHPVEAVQRTVGHAHISTTLMYDKRGFQPKDSASLAVRY